MFCPNCGIEDVKSSQFCRACGAELPGVRANLEQRPDTNPIVANPAREEIGRALAEKIRQFESAAELKVLINDILPVAERFLETPEEKRQRSELVELEKAQDALRIARAGAVTSALGFTASVVFLFLGLASHDIGWMVPFVPSVLSFLVGVGILLNALFFTVLPPKQAKQKDQEPRTLEEIMWGKRKRGTPDPHASPLRRRELAPPEPNGSPSVTEARPGSYKNLNFISHPTCNG